DMFYTLNSLYSENLAVLEEAIDKGGNSMEYIVLDPAARIVVYQFKNELLDAEKARTLNVRMNDIADYNIENDTEYGEYWQTAKDAMNGIFVEIEDQIFDCNYFKDKLLPKYKENPEDLEVIKFVYNKLKSQNCPETDTDLMELKTKYETKAAAINAAKQAEFEANNPGVKANKLYKQGDFQGAISKYKEAIANESDPSKQAGYYFSIASIQFRKLKSYSAARESARKAASLRQGWGSPYMLIGDMYASSSRSCGDAWQQRLAVLAAMEKYSYAKSIDSEVAADASKSIGRYSSSLPSVEDGFQRGIKEGQKVKVKCWIGETVRVRYQK
ncbi:MAG: tetratricopeptide repeat protein, partial [Bacteroidota bacterium]